MTAQTAHAIPAPAGYLDCFASFECNDDTYLSTAPLLTEAGENFQQANY